MKLSLATIAALGISVFATPGANAQFYKIHNADVSVGGTGQFTTTLVANGGNHQATTDSVGFVFTASEHPVPWAGIQVNYGYTDFSERFFYTNPNGSQGYVNVPTNMHEATGAYVFHTHYRRFQPFIAIGGGAVDFEPSVSKGARGYHQWRGAGLLEIGTDIPTYNPHFGFRIQGRSLNYRAPNFGTPVISSRRWVTTSEPEFGAFIRF